MLSVLFGLYKNRVHGTKTVCKKKGTGCFPVQNEEKQKLRGLRKRLELIPIFRSLEKGSPVQRYKGPFYRSLH